MEEGTLYFEIPDNSEIMMRLVGTIPANWLWVDGSLRAPKDLITSGQAEEHTGFALRRFRGSSPTIIGSYNEDERKERTPDLFTMMVERKLPGFVVFDEVGIDTGVFTLELAVRIAVGLLGKGYRGGLRFYKNYYDDSKFDNPARCDMIFNPWHGHHTSEEAGSQPARVKIEWKSRFGGTEADVTPIINFCRSLNLREYAPAAPLEAAAS